VFNLPLVDGFNTKAVKAIGKDTPVCSGLQGSRSGREGTAQALSRRNALRCKARLASILAK
jgi:hypothetical protein